MTDITIALPDDYVFDTKINGQIVQYDPAKMHSSWLRRFLEKGMQRLANDMFSGETGQTKFDLVAGIAAQSMSGEVAPVRQRGGTARLPDDVSLALKLARQDLNIIFKKVTGKGKASEFAEHEKIAPFFTFKDNDVALWNNDVVQTWVEKQAKDDKRDYLAEAKKSLEIDESVLDL